MTISTDLYSTDTWLKLSNLERDAAYDNRAAVVGADALIASRKEASRAMRAQYRCHADLPFGDGPRESWDIFPSASAGAPCFVFIHGGYWQRGDREDFFICARGALETGWSAALCGYPLAPQATLTQIVAKIPQALDWLSENGSRFGAGGPVILCGWSAGAHLAALAANHPSVAGALCVSGIFDLAPIRETYLNATLGLADQEIARLSPLHLPPTAKPTAVAFGTAELPELQRQSRAFHRMRAEAGLEGHLLPISGANHFSILDLLRSKDTPLLTAAQNLLGSAVRD